MPVPVKRRYTWWRAWKYAKEDIQSAIAQFCGWDADRTFILSYEFILPIAAELVRLAHPKLDGPEFDRLVIRVARALFVIPKSRYDH